MFFVISKVLGFCLAPSNMLIGIGLVGAVATFFGAGPIGPAAMGVAAVGLAVAGWSPLGNILMLPLEQRFPRAASEPQPAGLVILGGSFDTMVSNARRIVALTAAAERLTQVAELARRWPEARIVFTGGTGTLLFDGATEAELAKRMLESFGIVGERILLEDKSRNTVENARFVREMVSPRENERWMLVTSAYHMPRAVGCFRRADFAVEAWPVDYRTRGPQDALLPFRSAAAGLRRTDMAVREWVGLVAYWMLGYVQKPLPRP